ncbi:MAG: DegT/DnrJ/EryC1/StrS family aminotransferase [Bacteroidales bacterium]|nr:DegT/DnrJ/EryC1/StrS family aminotransferase [Bacteroidales bacterium]
MKVPFSPPRVDQKTIDAVTEVLKSGWITTGPKTKLFERRLTDYTGCKSTLCVNSGSAGLELVLRWFGVKEGDEVIVPAYTYAATANVVVHCGALPVMVDIGDDFNISASAIEKAITKRTKVIMPVDLAGFPCDYEKIMSLVEKDSIKQMFLPETAIQKKLNRILMLSDAAHSIGAGYKGRKSGTLSDIAVFSFHAVKNLTTAEGGAICLNLGNDFDNERLYNELNIKSLHGQTKDALAKTQPGNWKYDIIEPGYKCNFTDIQAAMGLVELERYDDDMLVRRKEIFDRYTSRFSTYDWAQTPVYETKDKRSSFHVYLLRIRNIKEEERDRIIQKIFEEEVAVNVHFVPLPMMTYYKNRGYDIRNFPVAFNNYSRVISLPVFYDLTNAQIEEVVDAVVGAVESLRN